MRLLLGLLTASLVLSACQPTDLGPPADPPVSEPERQRVKRHLRDGDTAESGTTTSKAKDPHKGNDTPHRDSTDQ